MPVRIIKIKNTNEAHTGEESKGYTPPLSVGVQTSTTIIGINMVVPQKIRK